MQKLNDLLKLSGTDLECAKLAANIHDKRGHTCFDRWKNSPTNNRDISYLFWSHYTENGVSKARRNFSDVGQIVVGLVRIPDKKDQWLLVAVGKITTLPDTHDTPIHAGIHYLINIVIYSVKWSLHGIKEIKIQGMFFGMRTIWMNLLYQAF